MAVNVRYTWDGDKLKRRMDAAARAAMDETNEEAAAVASGYSPVDTGRLRDSMTYQPAVKRGGLWMGSFGSEGVDYALYVEVGVRGRAGVFMVRRAADQILPSFMDRVMRHL